MERRLKGVFKPNDDTVRTNTCPDRTTSTTARSGLSDTVAGSNT